MNDQLENDLRELFAVRAAEVSPDAVERLRRIDYRPRTSRRWPLTLTALGVASGTAAVVSVDRKSTRLNSSHATLSRMPSSA